MVTYIIENIADEQSIRCLICGMRSFNRGDILYLYCGSCHQYHEDNPEPVRIVRSRQGKQVSPNGLPIKYCGRPGRWGNPFFVGCVSPINNYKSVRAKEHAYKLYEEYMRSMLANPRAWIHGHLHELENRNLSCWCKLTENCHVDIILQILKELKANELKKEVPENPIKE